MAYVSFLVLSKFWCSAMCPALFLHHMVLQRDVDVLCQKAYYSFLLIYLSKNEIWSNRFSHLYNVGGITLLRIAAKHCCQREKPQAHEKARDTEPELHTWPIAVSTSPRNIILTTLEFSGQLQWGDPSHGPSPSLVQRRGRSHDTDPFSFLPA